MEHKKVEKCYHWSWSVNLSLSKPASGRFTVFGKVMNQGAMSEGW